MIMNNKKAKNQLVESIIFVHFFVKIDLFLDTAFKQQRLPAWQPIITANTALPVFLIIGLIFIPIGVGLVITSNGVRFFLKFKKIILCKNQVLEYDLDYTDVNCNSSIAPGTTCADVLQNANYTGASCTCTINFTLDASFNVRRSFI
jgi:hypothetical protein